MTKVRIEGLDAVNVKLGRLIALCKSPRRPMTQAVTHLHGAMAKYPPKGGGWYRRTGTLGRRWTHRVEQDGRRGVVGNNTEYAPFVQSRARQRAPFRGRWQTEADVAERESKTVADFFRKAIRDEIR